VRGVAYSTQVEISLQNVHPFQFPGVPLTLAHNGDLARFAEMRPGLARHVRPELAHHIRGTTDSEWIYALVVSQLDEPHAPQTGTALVGGNVSGIDGPLVIDVALLGESSRPLRRAGARPGDAIVVTGRLGLAEAGLALLAAGWRLGDDDGVGGYEPAADDVAALRACLRAQLDPAPPLAFAAALATAPGIHAGMDLSDGLSGDLAALCGESGVSALVRSSRLPLGPALERQGGGDPLLHALHGGEDYELLLAVDPAHVGGLEELARVHGVGVVAVGALAEGPPSVWLDAAEGRVPLPPHAHQHFAPPEGER